MEKKLIITPKESNENNSQYAYRILYHNLMRLVLYPGLKLNEGALTAALGISSTPFRQALFRLREEGLIDIRSQSGTTVSFIDYNLLQENIFIRATLETGVIEQLCEEGLSDVYRERIQENLNIQSMFAENHERKDRFFELDNEFHKLLFEAAGKQWTYISMCKSCAQLDRLRYANAFSEQTDKHASSPFFYMDHKDLFETILRKNCSHISERIMIHLYGGKSKLRFPSHLLQYIINYPDDPGLIIQ